MTDDGIKEKLSIILDDEDSVDGSIKTWKTVASDPKVREQMRRYSIIREAMLNGEVLVPDRSFADRVSAAIAEEPTVLAPRGTVRATGKKRLPERVVSTAIAASLAVVGVLVARSLHDYSPLKGADILSLSEVVGPDQNGKEIVDPEFRDYLVSHYENAYLSGAQGMLPSVRLVSADASR